MFHSLQAQQMDSFFVFDYSGPDTIFLNDNCEAVLDWGDNNLNVTYEGPPVGGIIRVDLNSISGGFDRFDTIRRPISTDVTFIAFDNLGYFGIFTFTLDFIDTTKPVFDPATLPEADTITCLENISRDTPQAFDNCGAEQLTYLIRIIDSQEICSSGDIIREFIVRDASGNEASYRQPIHVLADNSPPQWTSLPQDSSVNCQNIENSFTAWVNNQLNSLVAQDEGCGNLSYGVVDPLPSSESICDSVRIGFYVEDLCKNRNTATATFFAPDTSPPTLIEPAQDISLDCSVEKAETAFQQWIENHGGMGVEDDCTLSWSTIPEIPQLYTSCDTQIEVTFVAEDACGGQVQSAASFTFIDTTAPAILSEPRPLLSGCTRLFSDQLEEWLSSIGNADIEDACTLDSSLLINYIINGQTYTLEEVVDSFERAALANTCLDSVFIINRFYDNVIGTIDVAFQIEDPCGNNIQTATVTAGLLDLRDPQISATAKDTTMQCADTAVIRRNLFQWYDNQAGLRAIDDCGLIFYRSNIGRDLLWQAFQDSMSVSCGNTASFSLEFFAEDLCGKATAMQSARFEVVDTTKPLAIGGNFQIERNCSSGSKDSLIQWLNQAGFAQLQDDCGIVSLDSVVWMAGSNAATLTPNVGPYPAIENLGCSTTIEATFYYSDPCGNQNQRNGQFRLLDNEAPVFNMNSDTITIACGTPIPLDSQIVKDNCVENIRLTFLDDTIRSTHIDSCAFYNYRIERNYMAADACGNESSFRQIIIIEDQEPPTFSVPADVTISCVFADSAQLTGMPTNVFDACQSPVEVSFRDSLESNLCEKRTYRIWMATDLCGNQSSQIQEISTTDTTAPVYVGSVDTFYVRCSENVDFGAYLRTFRDTNTTFFEDDCGLQATVVNFFGAIDPNDTSTWVNATFDSLPPYSCQSGDSLYQLDLSWLAIDRCQNTRLISNHWIFLDDRAPEIECIDTMEVFIAEDSCRGLFRFPEIETEDLCGQIQSTTYQLFTNSDTFTTSNIDTFQLELSAGIYNASFTAMDCAGNESICTFQILFKDTVPPTVDCPSDSTLFLPGNDCQIQYTFPRLMNVSDQCSEANEIEYFFSLDGLEPFDKQAFDNNQPPTINLSGGFNEVTIYIEDRFGNERQCKYSLTVVDTIAPIAICQPATVFANPSGVTFTIIDPTQLDAGSSDNCTIDSFWTRPQSIQCQDVGRQIPIDFFVFDEFGNLDSCSTIIRVESQRLRPTFDIDICDPDTLFLIADVPPPSSAYTFSWTGPNGFISNERDPIITNVDSSFSGTYTLQIEGFDACMASGSVTINIQDVATPSLSVLADTICEGDEVQLQTTNFSADLNYIWFEGLPPNGVVLDTTKSSVYRFRPTAGLRNYYLVVESETCTSQPSLVETISIINRPMAEVDTSFISVCEGEDIALNGVSLGAGFSYQWTGPNGFFSNQPSPMVISNAQQVNEGTYSYQIRSGSCISNISSVFVEVKSLPDQAVVDVEPIYCESSPFIINVIQPNNGDVYRWTSPQGQAFSSSQPQLNLPSAQVNFEGRWEVITENEGCLAEESTSFDVVIEPLLELNARLEGQACENGFIRLLADSFPDVIYRWQGPQIDTSERAIEVEAVEGLYFLNATSNNGCISRDTVNVDLVPQVEILNITDDASACVVEGSQIRLRPTLNPVDSGNYEYLWTGPGGYESRDSVAIIDSASQDINGTYRLQVLANACLSEEASIAIEVTQIPNHAQISGPAELCAGGDVNLELHNTGQGDFNHQWIVNGDTINRTNNTIFIDSVVENLNIQVIPSVNGCIGAITDTFKVQVISNPDKPIIQGQSRVCEGSDVELSILNPTNNYFWIDPSQDTIIGERLLLLDIGLNASGNYLVYATGNNCISAPSDIFTLEVIETPQVPVIGDFDNGLCVLDNPELRACIDERSASTGATYFWFNQNRELLDSTAGLCITLSDLAAFENGTNALLVESRRNQCNSESSIPVNLEISIPSDTTANAGLDAAICDDREAIIQAQPPQQATGRWFSPDEAIVISQPNSNRTTVDNLAIGENIFIWTLSDGFCVDYAQDTAFVLYDEEPLAVDDEYVTPFNERLVVDPTENDILVGPVISDILEEPEFGTLQVSTNQFIYFPRNGYIGTDAFTYIMCSANCPMLCSEATVSIQVGDESLCDVPTIFTPNQDGINDFFTVQCLSAPEFQNNSVIIFNQYGDEVFSASPYLNDWDGTYNGEPLPVGTYFFVVDYGDGRDVQKGFLILER